MKVEESERIYSSPKRVQRSENEWRGGGAEWSINMMIERQ